MGLLDFFAITMSVEIINENVLERKISDWGKKVVDWRVVLWCGM